MRVARSGLLVERNKAAAGRYRSYDHRCTVSDCNQLLPRGGRCRRSCDSGCRHCGSCSHLKKRLCESQAFVFIE